MKNVLRLLVVGLVLNGTPIFAESYTGGENNNPFLNTTPAPTGNAPQSNAGDAKFFGDTSTIQDNSAGNAANGREYKAGDAQRQGNAGTGAAIAAGSALTAAGMQQLSMLNFPEAARLFGLAGMEFAQAGADAASASANGDQRSMLLANAGQSGNQATFNPQDVAKDLMTDQARAALQAQGVDPSAFLNQLTSGNIRSGSDALSAIGKGGDIPAETVNDYSSVDLGSFFGSPPEDLGDTPRELLGMREDAQTNALGGGAVAGGGSGGSLGSVGVGDGLGASPSNGSLSQPHVVNGSVGTLAALDKKGGLGTNLSTGNGEITIPGIGVGTAAGKAELAAAVSRAELLSLGVTRARGQNIFRVANRNYRSFSKWRALRANRPKGHTRDIASF